jgi:hypothetical protein
MDIAIDLWWNAWAAHTAPATPPALVLARAKRAEEPKLHEVLTERLKGQPEVTTVSAASLDEAMAFVAATLLHLMTNAEDALLAWVIHGDRPMVAVGLAARSGVLVL